jgi:hypothetical protein
MRAIFKGLVRGEALMFGGVQVGEIFEFGPEELPPEQSIRPAIVSRTSPRIRTSRVGLYFILHELLDA